mmetsp:Transcript_104993/g.321692  ORF Transcript_104993/g.321692 Transcript_104993/m.321692 type:complete len:278 (+) Transcript_104993:747-1580(+)
MFTRLTLPNRPQCTLSRTVVKAEAAENKPRKYHGDKDWAAFSASIMITQFSTRPGTIAYRKPYSSVNIMRRTTRSVLWTSSPKRSIRRTRHGLHFLSRPCQYTNPRCKSSSTSCSEIGIRRTRSRVTICNMSRALLASNFRDCSMRKACVAMYRGSSASSDSSTPRRVNNCRKRCNSTFSLAVNDVFKKIVRTPFGLTTSSGAGSYKTTSGGNKCSLWLQRRSTGPPMGGTRCGARSNNSRASCETGIDSDPFAALPSMKVEGVARPAMLTALQAAP